MALEITTHTCKHALLQTTTARATAPMQAAKCQRHASACSGMHSKGATSAHPACVQAVAVATAEAGIRHRAPCFAAFSDLAPRRSRPSVPALTPALGPGCWPPGSAAATVTSGSAPAICAGRNSEVLTACYCSTHSAAAGMPAGRRYRARVGLEGAAPPCARFHVGSAFVVGFV